MESVIRELYLGHLNPSDTPVLGDREYEENTAFLRRGEEKLLASMTQAQLELYQDVDFYRSVLHTIENETMFLEGFRLGARIVGESLLSG